MLPAYRKFRIACILLPFAAAGVSMPTLASAQEPSDKCVAPLPSDRSEGSSENRADLSEKLDSCNGELKAPPTGDGTMVEPAPDTGKARVVRPDELPPEANPSNGSGG